MSAAGFPSLGPLEQAVVDRSAAGTWTGARKEWDIVGSSIAQKRDGTCICGQKGLKNLFTISNRVTGELLEPIGSNCINLFGRTDLDDEARTLAALSGLKAEMESGVTIDETDSFLSEKLFDHFHAKGVIDARELKFMKAMYRKRTPKTTPQDVWWKSILSNKIVPYVLHHPKLR